MPVGTLSYAIGAIAFSIMLVLLFTRWRGRLRGALLVAACGASVAWCLTLASFSHFGFPGLGWLYAVEALRGAAWMMLLLAFLDGNREHAEAGSGVPGYARWMVHAVWAGAFLYAVGTALLAPEAQEWMQLNLGAGILVALAGLMLVEQLYRNLASERRYAMKYLCIAVGAMFAYDLYIFADGLLFHALDPALWQARGAINALIVPVLGIAIARNPDSSRALVISRRLAFYSTTLAAVGVYLLAMAAGGYYVRIAGGTWGAVVQIVFFFGAAVILMAALFSGQARASLKVLLTKHFYTYKYDYREEWLRLSKILLAPNAQVPLPQRALTAVAEIVESPLGGLWLRGESSFVPAGGDMAGTDSPIIALDDPLAAFMAEREWIVQLDEIDADPALYDGLALPTWLAQEKRAWLIVPLLQETELLGLIVLARPRAEHNVTWEDLDLLKTVGRQVAGVLAQNEAAQQLAQTQQFEAYNRLTAFIMHDLKNLIAQQSLVVGNAARHKDNPEFIEDAISTVENSVARMNHLLEQLQRGHLAAMPSRLDMESICEEVCATCSPRGPHVTLIVEDEPLMVEAARESLAMVLGHVVRNAQDAAGQSGEVSLTLRREGQFAVAEIEDNGEGMDEQFLRERLFKPFESTKGSKGMGIGAYQTREFARAAGGDVSVSSTAGVGTRFVVRLPLTETYAQVQTESAMQANGAVV